MIRNEIFVECYMKNCPYIKIVRNATYEHFYYIVAHNRHALQLRIFYVERSYLINMQHLPCLSLL